MRLLLPLLCAALLSGCAEFSAFKDLAESVQGLISGTDNADPPNELQPLEPTVKLEVLWDATVGKGYDGQVVNLVPAVVDDRVYAADRRGLVEARNRLNGEKLWSAETELALASGPVAAGELILVGSSDGDLAALSAVDGSLVWKTTLSSEILALPRVQGGVIVVRASDGRITALDKKTGATRWAYERTIPPLSVRSLGSPTLADGMALDGFGGGKLVALGLEDGKPAWEATVAIPHGRSEVERLVEMDSDAFVKGDTAYVTGYQAGVAAVNLKDGEVQWRQEQVYSSHGLTGDRHGLFLTDASSDVWQLDTRGGADLWKQEELHMRRLTVPALVNSRLVVGDFEGWLHALSQDDGGLVGRVQIDDEPIRAAPVVYEGIVYVYSAGGVLAAVALE
jgi:outer membrane protein assembly factor BamB